VLAPPLITSMPLAPATILTFSLLTLALLALWLPPLCSSAGWKDEWRWIIPFVLAVVAGLVSGVVHVAGVAVILAYAGACRAVRNPSLAQPLRVLAGALLVGISISLMLHIAPGFQNPRAIDRVVLSPDGVPFTKHLNFDKAVVGLFLLGVWWPGLVRSDDWKQVPQAFAPRFLLIIGVVLLLSLGLGYVRWDPKVSSWFPLWAWSTLFFTVIPEEAFFRGLIQISLERGIGGIRLGRAAGLTIASVLFGFAHLAGGPEYVLLAAVAGAGYGWIYLRTNSIGAAILAHFGVNVIHFTLFTYPALAGAVGS
jgi:membrane protease YdiL (CAAX protease family)